MSFASQTPRTAFHKSKLIERAEVQERLPIGNAPGCLGASLKEGLNSIKRDSSWNKMMILA